MSNKKSTEQKMRLETYRVKIIAFMQRQANGNILLLADTTMEWI